MNGVSADREQDGVVARISLRRLGGLVDFRFTLTHETVRVRERRYLKSASYELPVDHLPAEHLIQTFFSRGAIACAVIPLGFALVILMTLGLEGAQDAWSIAAVCALCALPGIAYFIMKLERLLIMHGDGCHLVMPFLHRQSAEIAIFLDDMYQAKLRLISRRIAIISGTQMADDMYRRLSYLLDKRIIRQRDYEAFVPTVKARSIQVGG